MSPHTAITACFALVIWLIASETRRKGGNSAGTWIVLAWLVILGTRPVSTWLGEDSAMTTTDDYAEGSPIDRNVFLLLLVSGLFLLFKRGMSWRVLRSRNAWIVAFYIYCGLSALWSDYQFVAFKRWIKDLGNVIMVLVILTEKDRLLAIRSVLVRCSYLLIPLSVVLIKYFPELGRSYDRWSGRPFYQGATLGKNTLGAAIAVLTVFLFWDILYVCKSAAQKRKKIELVNRIFILALSAWLLVKADSASSIACAFMGACGVVVMSLPIMKRRLEHFEVYCLVGLAVLAFLSVLFDLGAGGLRFLGRDSTLTGRTDIWRAVLAQDNNALLGSGFYSFWLGSRVDQLWENYAFHLNQAHNGYIEIYLNCGLIGLGLFLGMLVSAGRNIKKALLVNTELGTIRLILWLMILVHNWTEASFTRLSILWFVLLLVMIEYPVKKRFVPGSAPRAVEPEPFPLGEASRAT